jgi:beta-1,2-mannobiose phosphorylase / 1,2-beta-oligomannan phosphorylase
MQSGSYDRIPLVNYELERIGVVMEPEPNNPREAWGVLNPASARGADGELYLFPRLVADGNYSCIGRARVIFGEGLPLSVERLGIALEPEQEWESRGVEDPRITFVARLGLYLMAYTAFGPKGPRVAIAATADLEHWDRYGLVEFGGSFDSYDNKDAAFFPAPVTAPGGRSAYALLHRPAAEERPGIWISFARADEVGRDPRRIVQVEDHRRVAGPRQPWEELKIGAGPPPIRTDEGWLLLHHGVSGRLEDGQDLQPAVRYCAGAMMLDRKEVWEVVARTAEPLLEPETDQERKGIVPNVVFPTALDERGDGTADVFYGMADSRIGAARLSRST